jgi:thiosulfate/3-mercaptopyruvate sulfurtransferase
MTDLVSVKWLHQNLDDENLVLLDASLKSTAEGKNSSHKNLSIPTARYFDLKNKFSDQNSPFPNTIPSEQRFEAECRKLGINQASKIVVFDNMGVYSSPRVWWMFKVMGHENISVLNGGLPEWINHGCLTEDRKVKEYVRGDFKAQFQKEFVKSYEDILSNLNSELFQVVDARSEGRFNGTANEPRKHLKSGHIRNSINIPYAQLLENGKYKSELELREIFDLKRGNEKEMVFSCGSGLTACIVLLASRIAGYESKYVYDGSWTEWAELQKLYESS